MSSAGGCIYQTLLHSWEDARGGQAVCSEADVSVAGLVLLHPCLAGEVKPSFARSLANSRYQVLCGFHVGPLCPMPDGSFEFPSAIPLFIAGWGEVSCRGCCGQRLGRSPIAAPGLTAAS